MSKLVLNGHALLKSIAERQQQQQQQGAPSTRAAPKGWSASRACFWQRFYTQDEALKCLEKFPDKIVVAMDKGTAGGEKMYAVASRYAAYLACVERQPQVLAAQGIFADHGGRLVGMHQYEMILDGPMRIYYDAEYLVALNPGKDGPAVRDALFHYIREAYRTIPNRPLPDLVDAPSTLAVETSHRPGEKFSYHGKLMPRCGVVANLEAQRAFWAHAMTLASIDLARDPLHSQASVLRVVIQRKQPNGPLVNRSAWAWDDGVYSQRRLMRTPYAAKPPKKEGAPLSFMLPEGKRYEDACFEDWCSALVADRERFARENATVLAIPEEWYAEAQQFWSAPQQSVADPSSLKRVHGELARAYREGPMPLDQLLTMATMGGNVALAARDTTLASMDGLFLHNFEHSTRAELERAMARAHATTLHFGDAVLPDGRYTLRELVFDIDATEYDRPSPLQRLLPAGLDTGLRACECAGGKSVCQFCWGFMETAAAVLRDLLCRRMGLPEESILWVFSGAKGLHVLCNDGAALLLTTDERTALVKRYLSPDLDGLLRYPLAVGGSGEAESVDHVMRTVLLPAFAKSFVRERSLCTHLPRHHWLNIARALEPTLERPWREALDTLPGTASSDAVWETLQSAHAKWLTQQVQLRQRQQQPQRPIHVVHWIAAHYGWPRIDAPVTTKAHGQLKTPFSLNRATQCVALPIEYPGENKALVAALLTLTAKTATEPSHMSLFGSGLARFTQWLGRLS